MVPIQTQWVAPLHLPLLQQIHLSVLSSPQLHRLGHPRRDMILSEAMASPLPPRHNLQAHHRVYLHRIRLMVDLALLKVNRLLLQVNHSHHRELIHSRRTVPLSLLRSLLQRPMHILVHLLQVNRQHILELLHQLNSLHRLLTHLRHMAPLRLLHSSHLQRTTRSVDTANLRTHHTDSLLLLLQRNLPKRWLPLPILLEEDMVRLQVTHTAPLLSLPMTHTVPLLSLLMIHTVPPVSLRLLQHHRPTLTHGEVPPEHLRRIQILVRLFHRSNQTNHTHSFHHSSSPQWLLIRLLYSMLLNLLHRRQLFNRLHRNKLLLRAATIIFGVT